MNTTYVMTEHHCISRQPRNLGSLSMLTMKMCRNTLGKVQKILPFFCDVRKYCLSFIMGFYENFFLVFEVSRTNYHLYQIFDARCSFLMLWRSDLRGYILIIFFWKKVSDSKKYDVALLT